MSSEVRPERYLLLWLLSGASFSTIVPIYNIYIRSQSLTNEKLIYLFALYPKNGTLMAPQQILTVLVSNIYVVRLCHYVRSNLPNRKHHFLQR